MRAALRVRSGRSGCLARGLGLLLLAISVPSCAGLESLLGASSVTPPNVTFQGASLVQAPSQIDLNAYYCPRLMRERGMGVTADFLCAKMFGQAPAPSAMQVAFDLKFNVANPNRIPLPLSEILTAINVFPSTGHQSLGAVCLRLCEPGDGACRGGADPRSCREAPGDIRSLDDFPQALGNLLVAQGVGAAAGRTDGFVAPRVLSGAAVDVTARLGLTPEALLPAIEQLARQSIDELQAGRRISFAIPYNLQGTVFGDAGSLGRIAAGYGPIAGSWSIPTERLLIP